MNKEFTPHEQALELKELGFLEDDTTCRCIQNEHSDDEKLGWGILYQQAFRWFREKHNIDISINTVYSKYNETTSKKYGGVIDNESVFTNVGFYDTYEEAELACLKKLIEIIKNK